jgi:hypothetical protein
LISQLLLTSRDQDRQNDEASCRFLQTFHMDINYAIAYGFLRKGWKNGKKF